PYAGAPTGLVGLETPHLQARQSFQGNIGSLQTPPSDSDGQSGRQSYYGGASIRGTGNWELGANLVIFDDAPDQPVGNSARAVTYVSSSAHLKYAISRKQTEIGDVSTAIKLSLDRVYYSRGGKIMDQSAVRPDQKTTFIATTIEVPVGVRLSDRLWGSGALGWTDIPQTSTTLETFGDRISVELGLAYRVSPRIMAYGSAKQIRRSQADAADATDGKKSARIYTVGAQYALTPQAAVNVFATNLFGPYGSARNMPFFPDDDALTLGVLFKYTPSGQGVGANAPRFHRIQPSTNNNRAPDVSGQLPSDMLSLTATASPDQSGAIVARYASDPDILFEFVAEQYHSGSASDFRSRDIEDIRVTAGGSWQALREAYGHPANVSLGVSAGRDLGTPSIGALFATARLSKSIGPYGIGAQASGAIFADVEAKGLGLDITRDIMPGLSAKIGATLTNTDETIWSAGLNKAFENTPLTVGIHATNAMGVVGIGTLYAAPQPHLKVSFTWTTAIDLL
ncbi:MAG: hypothetical protein ABF313_14430, partial [Marivita sp.]